jgi:uncharacterized ParB-like nuclease family protein
MKAKKPRKEKTLLEIDFDLKTIKKATPYLNDLTYSLPDNRKKTQKLKVINDKHRGYAWYYVFNGGNKTDAYRRAAHSTFHLGRAKLLPNNNVTYYALTMGGGTWYRNPTIQEAIRLIRLEIEKKLKGDVPSTMLEQLVVQATYDPSMFINPDGSPAFREWGEIPEKYRCCVEGINTTRYGKNGIICETTIKLVDRAVARKELLKVAPDLLKPDKLEIVHKTIDEKGNEVGYNFSKMSDRELLDLIQGSK